MEPPAEVAHGGHGAVHSGWLEPLPCLGGDGELKILLEASGDGRGPAVDAIVAHLLEKEFEEGLEVGSLRSLGGSGRPDDVDGEIEAGPGRDGVGLFVPQNLIYPKPGPVFGWGDVDF